MMFFFSKQVKQIAVDGLFFLLGSVLFGLSVSVFAAPNTIAPGGFTGLATLLNYLFGTPIGSVTVLLNVPIILWAMWVVGYRLVLRTVCALFLDSLLIDLFAVWVPPYHGDVLLAALFAGVLEGLGLALVFLRGGTTGGTVLIVRLIGRKMPHISTGKLLFAADFVVITISAIVYRSVESGLFALVTVFVSTRVMDTVIYGLDVGVGQMVFIFSEQNDRIADAILHTKSRGATLLYGKGAYSNRERTVLLCAVRKYEMVHLRRLVKEIDENAFLIIGEAAHISGEGFRPPEQTDTTLKSFFSRKKQ